MKDLFNPLQCPSCVRTLAISLFFILNYHAGHAQPGYSRIMDANIEWTPSGGNYNGDFHLYITDTLGADSLIINIGTQPELSDLYVARYKLGNGGSFFSAGTLDMYSLDVPVGTYAYHSHYYIHALIRLRNGDLREISIHSNN